MHLGNTTQASQTQTAVLIHIVVPHINSLSTLPRWPHTLWGFGGETTSTLSSGTTQLVQLLAPFPALSQG